MFEGARSVSGMSGITKTSSSTAKKKRCRPVAWCSVVEADDDAPVASDLQSVRAAHRNGWSQERVTVRCRKTGKGVLAFSTSSGAINYALLRLSKTCSCGGFHRADPA